MEMLNGKKTFIGIAIALIPTIAGWFGFDVTTPFEAQFAPLVEEIFRVLGAIVAIYGRMASETPGWLVKRKQ